MKVLQKMIWCLRVMIYHRVMLQELVELRSLGFIQELNQAKHQNQSQDHLALNILLLLL